MNPYRNQQQFPFVFYQDEQFRVVIQDLNGNHNVVIEFKKKDAMNQISWNEIPESDLSGKVQHLRIAIIRTVLKQ